MCGSPHSHHFDDIRPCPSTLIELDPKIEAEKGWEESRVLSLIVRKTRAAVAALRYVKAHADTVSLASIEQSVQFQQLLLQIEGDRRPPALLMLNQHALNMTFNFLCNTQMFPGVHERFISMES
uniref:Uncharacterized protein n=1 Tax=Globodera pallida TaxID=36090 RepID=A0A183C5Y2_GLOPA